MNSARYATAGACSECSRPTLDICVDCYIDRDEAVYVCGNTACRNSHEVVERVQRTKRCPYPGLHHADCPCEGEGGAR